MIYDGWLQMSIHKGDITNEKVGAISKTNFVNSIANAANEYLMHGAGVAGAIMRAGGQII